jgi:hypothetical protein
VLLEDTHPLHWYEHLLSPFDLIKSIQQNNRTTYITFENVQLLMGGGGCMWELLLVKIGVVEAVHVEMMSASLTASSTVWWSVNVMCG